MIDLHVHTTASDGQYTPTEIINQALSKNLKAIAITDHDTVAGLKEAKSAAEGTNLIVVPGVELNITYHPGEFHLLGLGLKEVSPSLKSLLDTLNKNRDLRNESIIKNMQNDNIDINIEEIKQDFPNTIIGRPHFAAEMVKKGIVKTRQQAFDQYLAKGRKYFVDRIGSNLDEAIIAIRESGGQPVLAHPMSLYMSWGKLPDALQEYFERGITGLEAFHPGARVSECFRLEELGKKIGYFITAGSDFHGEKIRTDRRLAHTCGGKRIEDKFFFQELQPHLN